MSTNFFHLNGGSNICQVWIHNISKDINPAGKYSTVVIPAEAGIQKDTGCRIKKNFIFRDFLEKSYLSHLIQHIVSKIATLSRIIKSFIRFY
jgi:hypothetical protein